MARCQMLLQENEELGKTIASGKTAKLEGEIALQKTLVTEMKNNQSGMIKWNKAGCGGLVMMCGFLIGRLGLKLYWQWVVSLGRHLPTAMVPYGHY